MARLFLLISAYLVYLAQLPLLVLGCKKSASLLSSVFSRQLLKSLGVNVVVKSNFDWSAQAKAKGYVHIYNHENPLDVFIIHGYLRLPSITTAGSHLGKILPFFDRCASNSGHILLDHMDSESRRLSVLRSFELMSIYGQMIIAPNGSLVTSIYQRASRSPQVIARKFSTRIAPWVFRYGDVGLSRSDLYSPLAILVKRLMAPEVEITCSLWEEDLDLIPVSLPKNLFEPAVIDFYCSRKEQC
ncbi:1-acyl-sn-glycerol-3-phosphate acyltransferase [Synechococcus sp. A15-62]|uniref:1-acyl-sn-glycerol-3-phosphate acyltransferase n=1 Tax=Synechococcus sp. A15-62 TaxID=1050657 RepID=UPI001645953D|nr:1-acyl-sn-glycerol-3-phosphate acyltransferase [Synechococcus sp. A15-62]